MNKQITIQNINNKRKIEHVIVLFYMDKCFHCENMKDDWEQFKNNSPIKHSEIEHSQMGEYKPVNKEGNIQGFPTIRLYHKNKLVKEYDGDRSYKDIMKFVKKYTKKKNIKKNNLQLVKANKNLKVNSKLLNEIKNISKKKSQKKSPKKSQKKSKQI